MLVTADTVETIFAEQVVSPTIPEEATEADPWAGQERVNVLLLGGDGGEGRTGVRTDSVILVSIDTKSGKTVMFSLPRNMMYAEFPEDSPLHDFYPDGYQTGQGDPGFDMLNAIYSQVPVLHPGALGDSDNEGADAVKEAVSGSLGIPVDYYLLVNLEGFKTVVDAMGGITVNINEPVAINGNTDAGIPPFDYLQPGPEQHSMDSRPSGTREVGTGPTTTPASTGSAAPSTRSSRPQTRLPFSSATCRSPRPEARSSTPTFLANSAPRSCSCCST